ncbi:MAG: ABC transporter permease [Candidatus Izemoplasmataceae bacterium]
MKNRWLPVATVLFIILLWQIQAFRIGNSTLFPYPVDAFNALMDLLGSVSTYQIIGLSMMRLVLSAGISSLLGIAIGVLAGLKPDVGRILSPVVSTLRTLPVASLIVVILILFGQQFSLYVITFLMLFPINYEGAKEGILTIDQSLEEVMTIETSNRFKGVFLVRIPLAFSHIKTAFLQSIGLGFKVLVVAEFIAQTPRSLGHALYMGKITLAYDQVFAWTILLIVIVISIEHFINRLKTQ